MKSLIALVVSCLIYSNLFAQQPDLLITNARILDGTGNSWFWGSLYVSNGKISKIERVREPFSS
ncbi:MAG TPA: hypothetical protein VFX73_11215 [Chitinophagaceae bacterium]|nr:hypothetical protein [Chitinophagaceae bacterium]